MAVKRMMDEVNHEELVIYRMTITLKDGRVIRRPDGRPFRIVIRGQR